MDSGFVFSLPFSSEHLWFCWFQNQLNVFKSLSLLSFQVLVLVLTNQQLLYNLKAVLVLLLLRYKPIYWRMLLVQEMRAITGSKYESYWLCLFRIRKLRVNHFLIIWSLYIFLKADVEEQNNLLVDAFCEILTKAYNGSQYYIVHTLDKEVVDKPLELNHALFHSTLRYKYWFYQFCYGIIIITLLLFH